MGIFTSSFLLICIAMIAMILSPTQAQDFSFLDMGINWQSFSIPDIHIPDMKSLNLDSAFNKFISTVEVDDLLNQFTQAFNSPAAVTPVQASDLKVVPFPKYIPIACFDEMVLRCADELTSTKEMPIHMCMMRNYISFSSTCQDSIYSSGGVIEACYPQVVEFCPSKTDFLAATELCLMDNQKQIMQDMSAGHCAEKLQKEFGAPVPDILEIPSIPTLSEMNKLDIISEELDELDALLQEESSKSPQLNLQEQAPRGKPQPVSSPTPAPAPTTSGNSATPETTASGEKQETPENEKNHIMWYFILAAAFISFGVIFGILSAKRSRSTYANHGEYEAVLGDDLYEQYA